MSCICIIDTCIFLNLLDVPGRSQDKESVRESFIEFATLGATFILPMATIIETGNHIAQNGNGDVRRRTAQKFCNAVKDAFGSEPPYRLSEFPNTKEILSWLDKFPDLAGQNKSSSRTSEGTSFGDLSIIEEFNTCLKRFAMSEVFIWSLDSDLEQYRHTPSGSA